MTQKIKKITALALLLCFIAPTGVSYLILKVKQYQLKEEIKLEILKGMDPGELMEMTLTQEQAAQLEWEHKGEFMYQGQSYDVVEKIDHEEGVTYRVWWDKAETKIKTQLTTLVNRALNGDPVQKDNQQKLEQLFKTLYYLNSDLEQQASFLNKPQYNSKSSNHYKSKRWSPPIPPPLVV